MNATDESPEPVGLIPAPWQRPPSAARMNKLERRSRSRRLHVIKGEAGTLYTIGGAEYVKGQRGNLHRLTNTLRKGRAAAEHPVTGAEGDEQDALEWHWDAPEIGEHCYSDSVTTSASTGAPGRAIYCQRDAPRAAMAHQLGHSTCFQTPSRNRGRAIALN